MNKKIAIIISIALVAIIGIFSIGIKKEKKTETDSKATTTVSVTDANGEKVELNKNPKRIVVFDYGMADILKNLDVDIVGLPKSRTLPEILSVYADDKYANVGDLKEPDFEAVEALNPDLIIIGGRQAEQIDSFTEIAPTVYLEVDGENYMDSFSTVVTDLGNLFDKQDEVKKALNEIEKKVADLNKVVSEKGISGSVVMANEGGVSLFSQASRYGIVYSDLGFKQLDKNIEESTHGQQITFEYFLENNSDYVFVIDRGSVTGKGESAQTLFNNEIMNKTDVAKNDKIVYLNSVVWYTMTGGIESTNIMIDEIAKAIK
ncbi:siderophore ABC transporter substrate-binding protein [Terrisporobacter vanillatitrophus]|uniref:siderophore ABC transporter substrate-binding protein n=1 Tax=Terrisporobacter vanillatitrophus TaxID=3058402 RepID=UPI003367CFF2